MPARAEVVRTATLAAARRVAIRRLCDAAFAGDFSEDDWHHALGGWHALVERDGIVVAHAAVVERRLDVGGRTMRAGYVEAVAVQPDLQRAGFGTAVMTSIGELVQRHFDLGALSSGEWGFYERLGWERWRGPTYVLTGEGIRLRTSEEDAGVMVMRTARTGAIDLTASIVCEERVGDSW